MPYQTGVVEALHDHGLTVGYCPGWQTRGSPSFAPRGHVVHHDAGSNWTTPPGILHVAPGCDLGARHATGEGGGDVGRVRRDRRGVR